MSQVQYTLEGAVAIISMNNPPMNGLGYDLRIGIAESLTKAQIDPAVKAIVLTGSGSAFSSGADIKEFNSPKSGAEPNLLTLIAMAEGSRKPVVAAIHSICMGGGFELALGCHYRIVQKGTQIALPEVKLGLVPGAGGTQRLPRILPLETALNMIVSGAPIKAEKFEGTKLFDQIVEKEVVAAAVAFAAALPVDAALPRIRDLKVKHPDAQAYLQFARNTVGVMAKNFPAPMKCIECVAASISKPFDAGMKFERENFLDLLMTPESRALRHAFFGERAASRISDVPDDTPLRPIKSAAVIGAGTMGGGITMNFVNAGIPVSCLRSNKKHSIRAWPRFVKTTKIRLRRASSPPKMSKSVWA